MLRKKSNNIYLFGKMILYINTNNNKMKRNEQAVRKLQFHL